MLEKEFLIALRDYIERVEVMIENEWGMGKPLIALTANNKMPRIYDEVLRRLVAEYKEGI